MCCYKGPALSRDLFSCRNEQLKTFQIAVNEQLNNLPNYRQKFITAFGFSVFLQVNKY